MAAVTETEITECPDEWPIRTEDELSAQLDCILGGGMTPDEEGSRGSLQEHFPCIKDPKWRTQVMKTGKSPYQKLAVQAWETASELRKALDADQGAGVSGEQLPSWRWAALAWTLRYQIKRLGVLEKAQNRAGKPPLTELELFLDWLAVRCCMKFDNLEGESAAAELAEVRLRDYREAEKLPRVQALASSGWQPGELDLEKIFNLKEDVEGIIKLQRELGKDSVADRIRRKYENLKRFQHDRKTPH